MYRRSVAQDELNDIIESAKTNSSNNPSGLFDGGFSIIDEDSRRYLIKVVNDIAGARSTSELKQAYLAYTYLGLSCGVSINDIITGLYSNKHKNYALGLDPGEWVKDMLNNAGLLRFTSTKKEVKSMVAANTITLRHKNGSGVGVTLKHKPFTNIIHFGQNATDSMEMFLDDDNEEMIGHVNEPKKKPETKQTETKTDKKPEPEKSVDINPAAAAHTMPGAGVQQPHLVNGGPLGVRFDAAKFFNGSRKPVTTDVNLNITKVQNANPVVEVKPPLTILQQQVIAGRDKLYAPPSEKKWKSNPMDAKLLEADSETKAKVVSNHVKMLAPRDVDEDDFDDFISFLTSDKFKTKLTEFKSKCEPNNPHLVELELEKYIRPADKEANKYDIVFRVETETGRNLIIMYKLAGTNKKGNKKGKIHNSVFFLD